MTKLISKEFAEANDMMDVYEKQQEGRKKAMENRAENFTQKQIDKQELERQVNFFRDKTGYVNNATARVFAKEENINALETVIELLLNDIKHAKNADLRAKSTKAFMEITNLKASYQAPVNIADMKLEDIQDQLAQRGLEVREIEKELTQEEIDKLSPEELEKLINEKGLKDE